MRSKTDITIALGEGLMLKSKEIYNTFISLSQGEQKAYLDWIYEAKTESTKVNRIAEMINRLQRGLKLKEKLL
jgi:uncharacterized protein YdeI (YjbR/CyaY-like superfamily)